ncbi:hypothetical protein EIN_446030 [Entamoeba invadens IP1]|uniref:Uncharacterized protein n=1 Tax=Entamoeba invadens IP1 TaxID=370355 RepID=L7FK68_ENTIV|nr:hypothetical protein EIN_446030 [Entamoeba invadens IP1]ELP86046.1 hypothetical protein EIN_446030 [Entamoeba invadens IP1]|eukprot:XP_004185392.1 hypothetical protein EIN_446030 [Entamoeba invadens IP1]
MLYRKYIFETSRTVLVDLSYLMCDGNVESEMFLQYYLSEHKERYLRILESSIYQDEWKYLLVLMKSVTSSGAFLKKNYVEKFNVMYDKDKAEEVDRMARIDRLRGDIPAHLVEERPAFILVYTIATNTLSTENFTFGAECLYGDNMVKVMVLELLGLYDIINCWIGISPPLLKSVAAFMASASNLTAFYGMTQEMVGLMIGFAASALQTSNNELITNGANVGVNFIENTKAYNKILKTS